MEPLMLSSNFDYQYCFGVEFNSTATSAETMQLNSVDSIIDIGGSRFANKKLNVLLTKITAAGTETYTFTVEVSDDPAFGSFDVIHTEVVPKETLLGTVDVPIFVTDKTYIRVRMVGANTPDWSLTAWLSPIF